MTFKMVLKNRPTHLKQDLHKGTEDGASVSARVQLPGAVVCTSAFAVGLGD